MSAVSAANPFGNSVQSKYYQYLNAQLIGDDGPIARDDSFECSTYDRKETLPL